MVDEGLPEAEKRKDEVHASSSAQYRILVSREKLLSLTKRPGPSYAIITPRFSCAKEKRGVDSKMSEFQLPVGFRANPLF